MSLNSVIIQSSTLMMTYRILKFDNDCVTDFKTRLSYETYLVIMMWMLYLILFLTQV